jgi:hypothetical protein
MLLNQYAFSILIKGILCFPGPAHYGFFRPVFCSRMTRHVCGRNVETLVFPCKVFMQDKSIIPRITFRSESTPRIFFQQVTGSSSFSEH